MKHAGRHIDITCPWWVDWFYFCFTGNMWGTCTNGTEGLGCGRPETFRNCADVTIVTSTAGLPPIFIGQQDNPFLLYYRDFRSPSLVSPLIIRWGTLQCCRNTLQISYSCALQLLL